MKQIDDTSGSQIVKKLIEEQVVSLSKTDASNENSIRVYNSSHSINKAISSNDTSESSNIDGSSRSSISSRSVTSSVASSTSNNASVTDDDERKEENQREVGKGNIEQHKIVEGSDNEKANDENRENSQPGLIKEINSNSTMSNNSNVTVNVVPSSDKDLLDSSTSNVNNPVSRDLSDTSTRSRQSRRRSKLSEPSDKVSYIQRGPSMSLKNKSDKDETTSSSDTDNSKKIASEKSMQRRHTRRKVNTKN